MREERKNEAYKTHVYLVAFLADLYERTQIEVAALEAA